MEYILDPWPWYVSGPMIALVLFLLTMLGKSFGMSSNLRTLCTLGGADKHSSFFKFDWKSQRWNLLVALGVDRKSTRLNSSHSQQSRMPSSA